MAGKNPFEAMAGRMGDEEMPPKRGKRRKGKGGGFMQALRNARKKGK